MDLSQGPPRVRHRFPSALQLTLLVVQVSILYYGGHLVISGQMTSGNLISFIIYEFVLGDCMEVRGWLGKRGGGPGEEGEVRGRDLNRVLQGPQEVAFLSKGHDNTNKETNTNL